MDIILTNTDGRPIYEQIAVQMKAMIAAGRLSPGEVLPSIRVLARDLRISVITTKRAYDELERDGFIETVAGKGSFVACISQDFLREEQRRCAEEHLLDAVRAAQAGGITKEELTDLLSILFEEGTSL